MKIRNGFVSNSSSSSFACSICGDIESGWDLCPVDVDMFKCDNGHIMHYKCAKLSSEAKEEMEGYEIGSDNCPVCQLKVLTDYDALMYLLDKISCTRDDVLKEMQEKFNNLEEFHKFCKTRL